MSITVVLLTCLDAAGSLGPNDLQLRHNFTNLPDAIQFIRENADGTGWVHEDDGDAVPAQIIDYQAWTTEPEYKDLYDQIRGELGDDFPSPW